MRYLAPTHRPRWHRIGCKRSTTQFPAFSRLVVMLLAVTVVTGAAPLAPAQNEDNAPIPNSGNVTQESAADEPTPEVEEIEKVEEIEDVKEVKEIEDEQRRQNLASVLLILLAGVGILGVAMIAATMIWGAKLRRIARIPEDGPTQQDELWYLKSPPPTKEGDAESVQSSDDPPDSSAADGETAT